MARAGLIVCAVLLGAAALTPLSVTAQRGGMFLGSADDPAIQYATTPLANVVDDLDRAIQDGSVRLSFDGRSGYLGSLLDALRLPADSQLLVYSQGSLQGRRVGPSNPRAVYFSDRVAVAWVRDGDVLELAAHDANAGAVFYTLEQRPAERPVLKREFRCLGCHMTGDTGGVPGFLMFSTSLDTTGERYMRIVATDQRTPYPDRFGGWFATGHSGSARHLGNQVPALERHDGADLSSVAGLFDPDGYRAATSDIGALLVFSHQVQMSNLLTRASWEARAADPARHPDRSVQPQFVETLMNGVAEEVVDYMLFVDEAPLPDGVRGGSAFAARMAAGAPRDRRGRSLYELDLTRRLLKYPCSYLIYTPAFDALPPLARTAVYKRLWQVLSGEAREPKYGALSLADRQAIVEILHDTKPGLPSYFTTVTH
jgi:hypothetical protein